MNRPTIFLTLALLIAVTVPVFADFPVRQGTSYEHRPRVVYNSTDHEYLVIWNEWTPMGSGMYLAVGPVVGQRMSEAGTKIGSIFTIFSSGSEPAVVYNSANNEYLVAASVLMGGTTVQRVNAGGSLAGSAVPIATGMSNLHLVFNTLAGTYLLAGQEWVAAENTYHINTYRINASAQVLGTNNAVDNTSYEDGFGLAYAPVQSPETPTGRYLLVIGRGGPMLEMLDSDGKPIDVVTDLDHPGVKYRYIPFDAGANGGVHGFDVTYGLESGYSMSGPAFFIVWADENNVYVDADGQHSVGIWGSFVPTKIDYTTKSEKKDNSFLISWIAYHWAYESDVSTWDPVVAYNPIGQKYMVAWRETPGTEPQNDTKVNHIRANTAFDKVPPKTNVVLSATSGTENPRFPAIGSSTVNASALVVWEDCRDSASQGTDWDLFGTIYSITPVTPPPPPPPKTKYVVTNTNDGGDGSLRQAIIDANGHSGLDTISFDISGTDLHTIRPASELPAVTDPVLIDGYTQPGSNVNTNAFSSGTNAVLRIEIDGSNAGTNVSGLRIAGGSSTVRGLVINRFNKAAIVLMQKGNNRVTGSFLGTDANGANALADSTGITIDGVANNIIGGTSAPLRNVIAGNTRWEVGVLRTEASHNHIQGNYIGVDALGRTPIGKTTHGVVVDNGQENVIGGAVPGAGNVIVEKGGGVNLTIACVVIQGEMARSNLTQGNLIGVNVGGEIFPEGSGDGIYLINGRRNIIGGTVSGARNVISGNKINGLYIAGDSTTIQGNFIGTDVTGTKSLPNGSGLIIDYCIGCTVGGLSSAAGNVISGNNGDGLLLWSYGPGHVVEGNLIGLQVDGTSPLGNQRHGIFVYSPLSDDVIGGTSDGSENTVAFNGSDGVRIEPSGSSAPARIRVLRNSIFGNAGLGINLVGGIEDSKGVTANDPGDVDAGANNLQNYPIFTALEGGDFAGITGSLNSTPNTTFRLEFFMNPANDPVSLGQGRTYIGMTEVTTDGNGNAPLSMTIGTPFPFGNTLTATATDPDGNTSEFSPPIVAAPVTPTVTRWVVTNTADAGTGSLRWAIEEANGRQGWDTVAFNIPGTGVHAIQPQSALPAVTDNVLIDGFSQPGSAACTNGFREGNNASLMIEIDGTNAGSAANGLTVTAGHSRIRGLVIGSFAGDGIAIQNQGGVVVEACYIGTDATGTSSRGNLNGVHIDNVSDNKIGGTAAAAGNVISGNVRYGVLVTSASAEWNYVEGNYIGTDASGTQSLSNDSAGVKIDHARNNTVGGTPTGAGNVITGKHFGVSLEYAADNYVQGNLIGTNAAGDTTIGQPLRIGVLVRFTSRNTIGGTTTEAWNVVAGCTEFGILISGSDSNLVAGNYVGTDITGQKKLPNENGILMEQSRGNQVGGSVTGARNIISGNNARGLYIIDMSRGRNNIVQGNYIGTQADGQSPLGNGEEGVRMVEASLDSIGGEGTGNIIAFNGSDGIRLTDFATHGIVISRNSIFGNTGLGINLRGGNEDSKGVTANDPGDVDAGPNTCQNFPVITAVHGGSTTTVNGSLNSTPSTTFTLEFYSTPGDDTASEGEGQTFIGEEHVTTDVSGDVTFSATFATAYVSGSSITATATCPQGNTSEFSAAMKLTSVAEGMLEGVPLETALLQNFPNPFNPSTEIRYDLAKGGEMNLTLFDLLGRSVRMLASGYKPAGRYIQTLDASNLASGVYLYRLVAGPYVAVRRLIVLK